MFILLMEQSHNHPMSHHATTFSPAFKAKKCVTRPLVFFAGSARNPSSTAFAERSQTWKPNVSRYGGDPNKIEGEASRKGLWSHLCSRYRTDFAQFPCFEHQGTPHNSIHRRNSGNGAQIMKNIHDGKPTITIDLMIKVDCPISIRHCSCYPQVWPIFRWLF